MQGPDQTRFSILRQIRKLFLSCGQVCCELVLEDGENILRRYGRISDWFKMVNQDSALCLKASQRSYIFDGGISVRRLTSEPFIGGWSTKAT